MVSIAEIQKVFSLLEKTHPLTMLEELGHYSAFQLLVMTLLSARSKDSTVIPIVKEMFIRYPEPSDYVAMPVEKLEAMIRRIGFYHAKAKNVKALSVMLISTFSGNVPDTLEELITLPGVGRKTANCILAYHFKKPAIAVDVHVHRISNRLGWVRTTKESETEQVLMKLVPRQEWINVNRLLVGHGQTICRPINPLCGKCLVVKYCKFGKKEAKN
ncbi:endonuclease III [Candidatus Woesearchaeota archaeon]|nr:endonuclease III [Candidatus Woesearchaeota archaeon]